VAPFDRSRTSSYSFSIVTVAISCTVFEIKRYICQKTPIFHTPLVFNLHDPLEPVRIFAKGKGLGTCYSAAYMSQTHDQQRFTISEVAADWYEPMVPR